MKKFYALLLAGVMTIAFAMPTLAAPSPVAQAVESASTVSVPVSGATVSAPAQSLATEAVELAKNTNFLTSLNVPTTTQLAAVLDLTYSGVIPEGGIQIPLVINSAKAGDVVYVLHRRDDLAGKPWEKVGEGILGSDLTVTCTFTSFSPVIVMVGDSNTAAASGLKAPKTGEF